jgi:hypothetical protein
MNERIRQLAEQAMSATFDKFSGVEWSAEEWRNFYDTKFAELRNFYDTKFAELIVRECMQVVHNGINNATDWDSSSWDQCCENRMYAIQKHFGVEE